MIPSNLEQASAWLNQGILMPLRQDARTDTGEVIGVRKMTLWERFKVNFLLSRDEKVILNKSSSYGFSLFAQKQHKSLKEMNVTLIEIDDQAAPNHEVHDSHSLFDKNFVKLLKKGYFPIGDNSVVLRQQGGEGGVRANPLEPVTDEAMKKNQEFLQAISLTSGLRLSHYKRTGHSVVSHFIVPHAEATQTPAKTLFEHYRERNGSPSTPKPALISSGWVANVKGGGVISSIPLGENSLPLTSFPEVYEQQIPVMESRGLLTDVKKVAWTKEPGQTNESGAWYSSIQNGAVKRQFFKLHEMVNAPSNLIHQHPDKSVTVYSLHGDVWKSRQYDTHGKPGQWVRCDSPIKWQDNSMTSGAKEAKKETNKVSFDAGATVVGHDDRLSYRDHVEKSAEDTFANDYSKEYSYRLFAVAKQAHQRLQELAAIAETTELTDVEQEEWIVMQDTLNDANRTLLERKRFNELTRHSQANGIYDLGFTESDFAYLRASSEVEALMKKLPVSDINAVRNEAKISAAEKEAKNKTKKALDIPHFSYGAEPITREAAFETLSLTLGSDHPEAIKELCLINQNRFDEMMEEMAQEHHVEFYEHEILNASLKLATQRFNDVKASLNQISQSLQEDNPDGLLAELEAARLLYEESGSADDQHTLRTSYLRAQNAVVALEVRIKEAKAHEESAQDALAQAQGDTTEFANECLEEITGNIKDFEIYYAEAHWAVHLEAAQQVLITKSKNHDLDLPADDGSNSVYSLVSHAEDDLYSQIDDVLPANRRPRPEPVPRRIIVEAEVHPNPDHLYAEVHHPSSPLIPEMTEEEEAEEEEAPPVPPRAFSFVGRPMVRTGSVDDLSVKAPKVAQPLAALERAAFPTDKPAAHPSLNRPRSVTN